MAEVEEVSAEVCRERPGRQDEQTGPVFVPVSVVSWSPQRGQIEERVNSGFASDPLSFGSLCQNPNVKIKTLWFVWRIWTETTWIGRNLNQSSESVWHRGSPLRVPGTQPEFSISAQTPACYLYVSPEWEWNCACVSHLS